jgi:catechol 2,3-dioxygenase-like lactoylglutathione lyase family enzyme
VIDHVSTYAMDFAATRAFYQAVLPVLGYAMQADFVAVRDADTPEQRVCAFGPPGKGEFWIMEARKPATPRHLAFRAPSRAAVAAFHSAGLAAGARENGPPGLRPQYHADYFGAFLIDPDGNNIEAVCHRAE